MRLTEEERIYIARQAGGEYAIIPAVLRILKAHKGNRHPEDKVFLDYAHWANNKTWNKEDYLRLAVPVLDLVPEPWGPNWWEKKKQPAEESTPKPKKTKRRRKCGICGESGHNARTCPDKPNTPTVTHTDGIERLSPGFDPNPPSEVEEG